MIGSISKVRPCGHHHHYKYAHCKVVKDLTHISNQYKNDGDGHFKFDFNLDSITNLSSAFQSGNILTLDLKLPKATNVQSLCFNNTKILYITLEAPLIDNLWGVLYHNWSLRDFQMDMTKIKVLGYFAETANSMQDWRGRNFENTWDLVNAFNSNSGWGTRYFDADFSAVEDGVRAFSVTRLGDVKYPVDEDGICIYKSKKPQAIINGVPQTKFMTLPKLRRGDDMFNGSVFSGEAATAILDSLPTYTDGSTHNFTIGILVDYKYDPVLNVALKKVDNDYITPFESFGAPLPETVTTDKGWTLTVQWNGTKTSNAYPEPELPSYDITEDSDYIPDASKWNEEIYQTNNIKVVRIENNIAYDS